MEEDLSHAQARINLSLAYKRANSPVTEEFSDVPLKVVEGALPSSLRGVHYRNGPGRQEAWGVPYEHPFDGDGMITRFAFDGQQVLYRNRFVQTREAREEALAGRMLYRAFGTNLPGGLRANLLKLQFKNAANTSVVEHAGRLLALWEGGLPHALDPVTLETLGRETFHGRLLNQGHWLDRRLMPELPFSAHPAVDDETGELWNFGTAYGARPRLMLYRVDARGHCAPPQIVHLPRMSFLHDFVMTRRFRLFYLTPVAFDVPRTLLGLRTPVASLNPVAGQQAEVLLVPRDGGPVERYPARGGFIFHYANGFEDGERIVFDAYRMNSMPSAEDARKLMTGEPAHFGHPVLTRYVLDRRRGTVTEAPLSEVVGELPSINPAHSGREHRYIWSNGRAPGRHDPIFTAIARVDTVTGATTTTDLYPNMPGEALFVRRPGAQAEDDGWLLSLVYMSETHHSELWVFDASDLSCVCRLALPHHVPPGFHGTFSEGAEVSAADGAEG